MMMQITFFVILFLIFNIFIHAAHYPHLPYVNAGKEFSSKLALSSLIYVNSGL